MLTRDETRRIKYRFCKHCTAAGNDAGADSISLANAKVHGFCIAADSGESLI
jgi:hypothetical protein